MTTYNAKEEGLRYREEDLKVREIAMRMKELENELDHLEAVPFARQMETMLSEAAHQTTPVKKAANIGKASLVVASVIVAVGLAVWMGAL